MKELSIEEKAKAYDKAIAEFKPIYDLAKEQGRTIDVEEFERILPELKDGEDERIRKEIISALKCANHKGVYNKHIAWLEKQGEQKPTSNQFTPEQAGVLDKHIDKFLEQKSAKWSEDDEDIVNHLLAICAGAKRYRQFAGCSQDDVVKYQTWLKFLKDRVQPQQDWSEDDIKMFVNIKACLRNADIDYSKELDWLKSIKPQKQWKPSDEQLKSLQEVIDAGHFTSYPNALETLYEQLKQL